MPSEEEEELGRLRAELDGLLATRKGGGRWGEAVLGWCKAATGRLFTSGDPNVVTEWGLACLRSLLPVIIEHQDDLLPPALCAWLNEHVVPSLAASGGGGGGPYHDLTFLLLRGLLQRLVDKPPSKKRRRKR